MKDYSSTHAVVKNEFLLDQVITLNNTITGPEKLKERSSGAVEVNLARNHRYLRLFSFSFFPRKLDMIISSSENIGR
jgi:hypothetical protein